MGFDLSAMSASGKRRLPPRIVLLGTGGVGKTTWASQAPDPYFLFTEDSQGELDVDRFEPAPGDPVIRDWATLIGACQALHEQEHGYRTLVLDTVDFAEPLWQGALCAANGWENIETPGFGKGYLLAVDYLTSMLDWFDALQRDRDMAIIILGHTETRRFEPPHLEAYDRFEASIHKRAWAKLHYWAEAVFFANYDDAVVLEGTSRTKAEDKRRRAVGSDERVLYTTRRPAWEAKNRWQLPPRLPLEWQAFADALTEARAAE